MNNLLWRTTSFKERPALENEMFEEQPALKNDQLWWTACFKERPALINDLPWRTTIKKVKILKTLTLILPVDSITLAKSTSCDQTSNLNLLVPTIPQRTVPVWMPTLILTCNNKNHNSFSTHSHIQKLLITGSTFKSCPLISLQIWVTGSNLP